MGAADQPPISPDQARSAPSRSKPTSSHQRSGPKIKRLLNLGTKPGMAFPDTEDPQWKQLVAEWEQLDLAWTLHSSCDGPAATIYLREWFASLA
jgi:hypothetical protein